MTTTTLPAFDVTLCGTTYKARLEFGTYAVNDRLSISLVDAEDGSLVTRASGNVSEFPLTNENCALIKDYSENAGLAWQLEALGFIVPTGRYAESGFTELREYEVTAKARGEH